MNVAEYKKLIDQSTTGKIKIKKTNKQSYNDSPLENVECHLFKMFLDDLVRYKKIVCYSHIANETKDFKAIMRNTYLGVQSGVPDFIVVMRDKIIFIEMKREKGSAVSEAQLTWIKAIVGAGGYAKVCKGHKEAENYLESFL